MWINQLICEADHSVSSAVLEYVLYLHVSSWHGTETDTLLLQFLFYSNYSDSHTDIKLFFVLYIENPQRTGLVFQKLPKHMRRRVMSRTSKRLPRRLREAHMHQVCVFTQFPAVVCFPCFIKAYFPYFIWKHPVLA